MEDKPETVEEFLARGGKIQTIPKELSGIDSLTGIPKVRMQQINKKYGHQAYKGVRLYNMVNMAK